MKTEFASDKEHVYIDGKQFISLSRFHEALSELKSNNNELDKKNQELSKENASLIDTIAALTKRI